jgi:hypothetical protein
MLVGYTNKYCIKKLNWEPQQPFVQLTKFACEFAMYEKRKSKMKIY